MRDVNGNVMVSGYDKDPREREKPPGGFNWWGLVVLAVPIAVVIAVIRVRMGW